jgi:hypothetical protein
MAYYTIYDPVTGKVLRYGSAPDAQIAHQVGEGEVLLETRGLPDTYVEDGVLVPMAPQPTNTHEFDWESKQWIDARSLEEIKSAKWRLVKQLRDDSEHGGFSIDGLTFDSNPISQAKIQGAVQLALLAPESFTIDWTLANNSVATIDRKTLLAVGLALGQHVQQVHAHARDLRSQIEAAETVEQVEAVVWLDKYFLQQEQQGKT